MKAYWQPRMDQLRETLLGMGRLALGNLEEALACLGEKNPARASRVEEADAEVDELEKRVDHLVVTFVSTHSPAAVDCRFFLMGMKIGTELEEIADQATTIARRARRLGERGEPEVLEWPGEIAGLTRQAVELVRLALLCFEGSDPGLARQVIEGDQAVNRSYAGCARAVQDLIPGNPAAVGAALDMLTILKALERAADRAVNIAEDVVYLYEGEDIRHPSSA